MTSRSLASALLTLATFVSCIVLPNAASAEAIGTVVEITGPLISHKADGSVKALSQHSTIDAGDVLETGVNSYAQIKFIDNGELSLRPETQFRIDAFAFNVNKPDADSEEFTLIKGGFRSVTGALGERNHDKVKVHTPANTIGIRGTNFGALFCQNDCASVPTPSGAAPQNGLYVDVSQGAVVVSNGGGQQVFQVGQFGYVANQNTPPIVLPPNQGVLVTMPLSISQNAPPAPGNGTGGGVVDCVVR